MGTARNLETRIQIGFNCLYCPIVAVAFEAGIETCSVKRCGDLSLIFDRNKAYKQRLGSA